LDRDSQGLLLFSNDTQWTAKILDPKSHLDKTYNVRINCIPTEEILQKLRTGIDVRGGDTLGVKSVRILEQEETTSWLEIVLDEGKNRQIRRIFEKLKIKVIRLIRVAIGSLELGDLAKGKYRFLTPEEKSALDAQIDEKSRNKGNKSNFSPH
jgi:23S rRNA pseudouridine2605 synthase